MLLTVDRFQELEWHHARDERLRIHQHLRTIRDAQRPSGSSNPLRQRLGRAIVRLGGRVAGEPVALPAPTS